MNETKEPNRRWLFFCEDENGDSHYLQPEFFVGTYEEATHYANTKADEWENKIGGLILRLTIESHGIV